MGTELIQVEETYGPAMLACTELERNFVLALLDQGDDNHMRAAIAAGSKASTPSSQRVTGWRLAHNPRVIEAMKEEGRRRMDSTTIMAISQLAKIAGNQMHKGQLRAIEMILDRTGFNAMTEHKVTVEHKTEPEQIERLKRFAGILGLDSQKLLGAAGIVDAEFTDITPARIAENTGSTEGIEDLL